MRSFPARLFLLLWIGVPSVFGTNVTIAESPQPPKVLRDGWSIELVAAEPDLVTPVACCLDSRGRLLVIESHTHFPPEDYPGPKTDRIHAFADTDSDGTLDQQSLFYEGGRATMGLVLLADDWIVVATRSDVARLRDEDGDGVADRREVLLRLETKAEYPHNGLAGVAVGPDGYLYVGQGENFGEPYELTAADGSQQVGGGEGGNIFRLRPDGSDLQRVATGFWNPFGMCFDSRGRLWTVGNDPDAMPPCRLLHVVPSGDYGFQFRFGRAGTHPLQAWNGELPGTLPYAAGTGEAPCAVLPVGDRLWVTSWGDNRIESYQLSPRGASWSSRTEVVVQGDTNFRPVGMAQAADGSIYFTDWVRRDYAVHQTGRLWRLVPPDRSQAFESSIAAKTHREHRADALRSSESVSQLIAALDHPDPFIAQAAIAALADSDRLGSLTLQNVPSDLGRSRLLAAWRWRSMCDPQSVQPSRRDALIHAALSTHGEQTRLVAVRWAAELQQPQWLEAFETLLQDDDLTPRLFSACVAGITHVRDETAPRGVRDPAREKLLDEIASDASRSAAIRALAVQMLPAESKEPTDDELGSWIRSDSEGKLARESIRLLADRSSQSAVEVLQSVMTDSDVPSDRRADAVAALAAGGRTEILLPAGIDQDRMPAEVQTELERVNASAESVTGETRPAAEDIQAWMQLVGSGGNADAGRRVFMRAGCQSCHTHSGRGAATGPELTSLAGQNRQRVLESILKPSREIGPLYTPWKILTVDGDVLNGLKTPTPGVGGKLAFQGTDGKRFEIALEDIQFHSMSDQSIMPEGLEKTISINELRDLLAFLTPQP
ncbi:hypothetical protein FYK55_23305 [Roseiconus nitratireducens]|uniref:Cytochrome c domain-containing protein n=1 Tax=Roseiconus nitratireducens TaxID=2605748 RepID=A0A5M6D240_9BACT|nr:PVC-type heme-binding CxxCH protein [Roseiconus nitratireducens]KAA5539729.1 hypothetical protein FYK55_23305 [Roseiconus nitratireducens]